ncbi:MAG TPA: imidazolonepropionase [Actinomycetota bacterium]
MAGTSQGPGLRADFVLRGAGRLVTCNPVAGEGLLGVVERGALVASEGRVVWVGPERDLPELAPAPDCAEVDAGGRAVLPGLVDAHTHLVFAGDRAEEFAARLRGEPYTGGGIGSTVAATRAATDDELRALARTRLDVFAAHGVTTVEAKSGYGLTPEDERRLLRIAATLEHPVEVVRTFLGAHVVPESYADDPDGYVDLVCDGMLPEVGNLAEFCDVWCDPAAFTPEQTRRILRAARTQGLGLKVHAEQLARTGGAQVAAEFGAVSADHLEHATEEDALALARSRTVAVLLPGASLATGKFAPARMLLEHGVRVALSTDLNPGSSFTENLQLMVQLACAHLRMSPDEAILGVTRNAAAALSREGRVGSLEPGAACDLVVLEAEHEVQLAYHYGVNLVRLVIKAGREA